MEPAGGQLTLFSLAGSHDHVNPTQVQENERAKKMRDISGRKCVGLLEKLTHDGSLARMFSALLIGQEGWYSTRCNLIWRLKGTRYSRFYCQLYPSTLPTEETGFGLWPTPCARDTQGPQAQELKEMRGEKITMKLESIPGRIRKLTGIIGQINPMFYCEIMGFPEDWTIKPFLQLEESQSKQEETQ